METEFKSENKTTNRNLVALVIVGTLISLILVCVTAVGGIFLLYKSSGDWTQRFSDALSSVQESNYSYYSYDNNYSVEDVESDYVNPDSFDKPLTTSYDVKLTDVSCVYSSADSYYTYYKLTAGGEFSGPVGSKANVNSMQSGVAGKKSKNITLDCGGWQFEKNEFGYQCLRREGDLETMTYKYTEENLFYEWCPSGLSCADLNENTYFMNVYIYDPSRVTGKYHHRANPLTGASIDFSPFQCGGYKGKGLKFYD